MGYTPKEKIYRLKFADAEYAGLVVEAGSPTVGRIRHLMRMASVLGGADARDLTPEQARALDELLTGFVEALRAWNVDHPRTREPVPPTLDGIDTLGIDFVLPVVMTWMDTVAGPDVDLKKDSTSGPPSQEVSLPMETL